MATAGCVPPLARRKRSGGPDQLDLPSHQPVAGALEQLQLEAVGPLPGRSGPSLVPLAAGPPAAGARSPSARSAASSNAARSTTTSAAGHSSTFRCGTRWPPWSRAPGL